MTLEPGPDKKKPAISPTRILIWIAVGGIGLWLVISGLIGMIVKGG